MAGWTRRCGSRAIEGLKRSGRGLVRRYVEKMTGLSRAQITRLIAHVPGGDEVKARAVPAPPLPAALRAGGHRAAGRGGRGSRNAERAGHAEASGAGLLRLRRSALPALGGNFGGATVPAAGKPAVPRAARSPIRRRDRRRCRSGSGAGRSRWAGRDTCGWTRCIRATWRERRGSITSTRWMRSRNGRWWGRWRRSARRG